MSNFRKRPANKLEIEDEPEVKKNKPEIIKTGNPEVIEKKRNKVARNKLKDLKVIKCSQFPNMEKKITDSLKGSVHEKRKPYECDSSFKNIESNSMNNESGSNFQPLLSSTSNFEQDNNGDANSNFEGLVESPVIADNGVQIEVTDALDMSDVSIVNLKFKNNG